MAATAGSMAHGHSAPRRKADALSLQDVKWLTEHSPIPERVIKTLTGLVTEED